jgi:hypothetical protein
MRGQAWSSLFAESGQGVEGRQKLEILSFPAAKGANSWSGANITGTEKRRGFGGFASNPFFGMMLHLVV